VDGETHSLLDRCPAAPRRLIAGWQSLRQLKELPKRPRFAAWSDGGLLPKATQSGQRGSVLAASAAKK
jgi:hypothetical protein